MKPCPNPACEHGYAYAVCSQCDGEGRVLKIEIVEYDYHVRCPTCHGKGEILRPCPTCKGTGKVGK